MFSQLEDLDYADDIALWSTNARHLQQKGNVLNENAKKAGLHINMKKTKVMHLNLTEPHPQIMIDGEELEAVDDFTYLGSNISAENSVQLELTKQEKVIATSITYGNQTYIAWRQNFDSSTVTSYQYYYIDVNAGESPKMIWISSLYSKPSAYGEPATYSGQTRYLIKSYIEEQTHHQ